MLPTTLVPMKSGAQLDSRTYSRYQTMKAMVSGTTKRR